MLAINVKKTIDIPYLAILYGLTYLFIAWRLLPDYLSWDANLFVGLLLAPYICGVDKSRYSIRYLVPALVTLILVFLVPVRTMFFIAMLFAVLLLIENSIGKLSESFLLLLFLISPVFKYMIGTVDFPIRLWLTARVADLLDSIGINAIAAGNQIQLDKVDFSVDPACAGLNMLIMSLIICLFITMYSQRQTGKRLQFIYLVSLFLLTIGLNILSNFFRILLLVVFKIMPGTIFHDVVGIGCLLVYVILPLIKGIGPLINYMGYTPAQVPTSKSSYNIYLIRYPVLQAAFATMLLFIAFNLVNADKLNPVSKVVKLDGFTKIRLDNGILKFENKEALIYMKPSAFYVPGHDPKICWTGSGYVFSNIKKEKWNGVELYTGTLKKGKDKIYAAWWFDNGHMQTIDQLKWRWEGAKSKSPFYLININAATRQMLLNQVSRFTSNKGYLK